MAAPPWGSSVSLNKFCINGWCGEAEVSSRGSACKVTMADFGDQTERGEQVCVNRPCLFAFQGGRFGWQVGERLSQRRLVYLYAIVEGPLASVSTLFSNTSWLIYTSPCFSTSPLSLPIPYLCRRFPFVLLSVCVTSIWLCSAPVCSFFFFCLPHTGLQADSDSRPRPDRLHQVSCHNAGGN